MLIPVKEPQETGPTANKQPKTPGMIQPQYSPLNIILP